MLGLLGSNTANDQTLVALTKAIFNVAPGYTYLTNFREHADANGVDATANALAALTSSSNALFGASIISNLGLTGDAATAAQAYFDARFEAGATQGQVAMESVEFLLSAATASDATFGSIATQFQADVSKGLTYSQSSSNTTTDMTALAEAGDSTAGGSEALSTSVDDIDGGSGDDTFTGVVGASGTYNVGDNITGGAGTDTLKLLMTSGDSAGGLIEVSGVENVSVRLLGTAATAVTLNANEFSGVTSIDNASSLAASILQVSGVATDTTIALHGDTDINVGFKGATTASEAVSISLNDAGNFGATGAHTLAGTGLATANIDLDLANAGLIEGVNVEINGAANAARIEAGSNATAMTITGAGSAVLVTDDTLQTVDASGKTEGGVDITFQGASDVAVTGGAGNDIARFGTTLSNNDSFNGGAGDDTMTMTVSGFNRNVNTENVENATVLFAEAAGGTLNASGSDITAFTLQASGAGAAASVSQISDDATITLANDNLGNVTLDYKADAAATTVNIGSASGTVGLGTLAVTDVASLTINSVGVSGSVGGSIGSANFDSDLTTLSILTSGGEADLTLGTANTDISLGGTQTLNITTNGSASFAMATSDFAGTALSAINLTAAGSDAADITLDDTTGAAISTITLNASNGADIGMGDINTGKGGTSTTASDQTISIVQGATSHVAVANVTVTGQGTLTIDLTQNGTGASATFGNFTLRDTGTASSTQNLTIDNLSLAENGQLTLGTISYATAGAGMGTGGALTIGTLDVGKDGGLTIGNVDFATGNVAASVSDIALTVGASATATLGNFVMSDSTGASFGAVTVSTEAQGSAVFGTVAATAQGTTTISSMGTGSNVAFGAKDATGGTIGAIEVVTAVDGATATFAAMSASAIGAIAVAGNGDVTFGTLNATSIGEITSTQGVSGAFTIDLSGVTNAAEVNLGAATNNVTSGVGNDVITLTAGTTGNDTVTYTVATQGQDQVLNFFAGSTGQDVIALKGTALATNWLRMGDGSTADASDAASFLTLGNTASAMAAGTNVIVMTSAAANTAAVVDQLSAQVSFGSANMATGTDYDFAVVWTDGTDSYVSIATVSGTSGGASFKSASGVSISSTLVTLDGITPGELVAANFDFV